MATVKSKPLFQRRAGQSLLILMALAILTPSCMKEKTRRTYTIYRAEYSLRQEVVDNARLQPAAELETPGSFILYKNLMLLNDKDRGIHIIDYSDASNPVKKGFIPIPGNTGLSIRNDHLYADCFTDLLVFKITSADNIEFRNRLRNVFLTRMENGAYDSTFVQRTWISKDTTVTVEHGGSYMPLKADGRMETMSATSTAPGGTSVGSSLAVFAIVNEHLYVVDRSQLHTFSIADPVNPAVTSKQHVNWDVETIFPFKGNLFIGSMTGMFVYGLSDPANPAYVSQFNHARVCDPVIADDTHAFVTLRSGSPCGGFNNQLDVLDISSLNNPVIVRSYAFANPHGLSKDGVVLFLCDGTAGLKVLDATDVANISVKQTLPVGNALDVVAHGGKAFLMLQGEVHIYSYDQQFNVQLLGKINMQ